MYDNVLDTPRPSLARHDSERNSICAQHLSSDSPYAVLVGSLSNLGAFPNGNAGNETT